MPTIPDNLFLNNYGFYEVQVKPSVQELKDYYVRKYYQEDKGTYQKAYTPEEIQFFLNKLEQKFTVISGYIQAAKSGKKFLDIGCGEGWALKFFKEKDWDVTGMDYSSSGCEMHNPGYSDSIILGDINDNLDKLRKKSLKFNVVWLDNVLEHVISPLDLLHKCYDLTDNEGVLVIEVPNDFSVIQNHLLENKQITKPFWIALPDHLSYFNRKGLIALCESANWNALKILGDFPIDFNLFNPNSNYIENRSLGKSCHFARVEIENILHRISVDKTNELYEVLADMGLGRQIIGFFKKNAV